MSDEFKLHNNTLLGGFLAHMQAKIRERGRCIIELMDHPDATPEQVQSMMNRPEVKAMRDEWEKLRLGLLKVLNLQVKPFNAVVTSGPITHDLHGGRDPLRTTMRKLKYLADKARRKDPTITLMQSWDLDAPHHQPPESEQAPWAEFHHIRRI